MLKLKRRRNQRIVLSTSDGPIYITVSPTMLHCLSSYVMIDAPPSVSIYREELLNKPTSEGNLP